MQTLEIIERHREKVRLSGVSAHTKQDLLEKIAAKFKIPPKNTLFTSRDPDFDSLITSGETDIVINMISGCAGIPPTLSALSNGKTLLLGNKESIVVEGEKIIALNGKLIPVDSEHNAIFEILLNNPNKTIEKIFLPCSGGPFLNKTAEELAKTPIREALKHPRWNMGAKISIESATLINKGLEIIEAHYLFNLPLEKIEVFIHPECEIHGMVKFTEEEDLYAYTDQPDMRTHIENGLLRALEMTPQTRIKKLSMSSINLSTPDHKKFPGIQIVLNQFKKGRIEGFLEYEEKIILESIERNHSTQELIRRISSIK